MQIMELLTVKEVADYLKCSRDQVRKMIRSGVLRSVTVGREYRIPLDSLAEFIDTAS